MSEMRVVWRMANFWACAAMLVVALFFAWVIREGLRSTTGNVYIHTIIPAYAVFLYATLASLVNRRTVVANRDGLRVRNGPVPLGHGRKWIPRDDIAFAWHVPVETTSDSGDSVVVWHDVGIQTRARRDVPVFRMIKSADEAQAKARDLVSAFGSASDWTVAPVRQVGSANEDPVEKQTIKRWVVVIVVAVLLGIVWEVAFRRGVVA
jgi:hypothetical protein